MGGPQVVLHIRKPFTRIVALYCLLTIVGCATMEDRDVVQFAPMPVAEFGEQDLEPIQPREIAALLKAATDAFQSANMAQEREDHATALRQYSLMLELLLEADLDPTIFYNLRDKYEVILETTLLQARAYERDPTLTWREQVTVLPTVSGLEYPVPLPDRILDEIDKIVEVYTPNFEAGLNRSGRYLPYIRNEFREAGLPEDLAWLAMVESQYTPKIVSRAGAGGMWQFMKATGRRYDLNVDYYVDERYEWKKSTAAAIAYLQDLYTIFDGNWPLAISAYNMGENGLERAIAANGGDRNLWSLIEQPPAANRIRRETKRYYPKLLASAIVANEPERYGIQASRLDPDDTVYVELDGSYLLNDIEREIGVSRNMLAKLNPHLLHGISPPNRKSQIMVPRAHRQSAKEAVAKLPKLRPDTHVVRRGETPSGIATMYDVPVTELMRTNRIRSARSLQIGQRLVIPGRVGSNGPVSTSDDGRRVYTVKSGDSLSRIAKQYGVQVRDLQQWNMLGTSNRIHVGDRLYVAAAGPIASVPDQGTPFVYTVVSGDSLDKIARRYHVKLEDLLTLNNLTRRSTIHPGQKLKLFPAQDKKARKKLAERETKPQPENSTKRVHRVRPGENPSTIADLYGVRILDLLAWNGLNTKAVLHIGDQLTVFLSQEQAEAFKSVEEDTPGQAAKIIHVVRSGENPTTIARRYRVKLRELFEWNGWTKNPVLHIGDKITVYPR